MDFPVVKNIDTDAGFDGYHGYWSQDLTQPNPHFGDVPALRRMVAAAHEKGMKVILDIVTNHMGQLFYYDINENGQPDDDIAGNGTSSSIAHVNEYDPDFDPRGVQARTSLGEAGPAPIRFLYDPATNHLPPMPEIFQNPDTYNRMGRAYNFDDPTSSPRRLPGGLKDVNTSRCDVKQAFVDVYARWVELADFDGFRIDTVKHVEREFWRYFTQKVRQRLALSGKRNFFMFGESFDGRDDLCGSFTKNEGPEDAPAPNEEQCVIDGMPLTADQLNGVFYFPQYYTAIRDVFQNGLDTQRIGDLWTKRRVNYGNKPTALGTGLSPQKTMVNFLDNHDVPHFLFSGKGTSSLHNALAFIFTEEGIPCVYYGTEQEFTGGNDPANREDLWTSGYATDTETFLVVQRLAALRKKYVALRRGDQSVVYSTSHTGTEQDAGIFAFERANGDAGGAYALVVFNTNPSHASVPWSAGAPMKPSVPPGTVLVDVLAPSPTSHTVAPDGSLSFMVPPQGAALLIPQDQLEGE